MNGKILVASLLPVLTIPLACSNSMSDTAMTGSDELLNKARLLNVAQSSGCFDCHHIERDALGPSWHQVAKKYQDDEAARKKIIDSVKYGSKDTWGVERMPPSSPQVDDGDIELIVDYILALGED